MPNKRTSKDYEAIGPSQDGQEGYGPGPNPANPSDAIFMGRELPIIMPQEVVVSRPFREATRSPLHYHGGPGPDEAVTSREPVLQPVPGNEYAERDHAELRPLPGANKQPYAAGDNPDRTLNGAIIYGT